MTNLITKFYSIGEQFCSWIIYAMGEWIEILVLVVFSILLPLGATSHFWISLLLVTGWKYMPYPLPTSWHKRILEWKVLWRGQYYFRLSLCLHCDSCVTVRTVTAWTGEGKHVSRGLLSSNTQTGNRGGGDFSRTIIQIYNKFEIWFLVYCLKFGFLFIYL